MIGEIDVALPMIGRRPAPKPQQMARVTVPQPRYELEVRKCPECHCTFTADFFGPDKYRSNGLNRRCKLCNRERARVYHARKLDRA